MRRVSTRVLHVAVVGVLALGFLAGPAAQSPQPAAWLLFVDDLHLDFRNTGRLRDLIRQLVDHLKFAGLVGIHTAGPSNVMIEPTGDAASVRWAIKQVTGNGLRLADYLGHPTNETSRRADVSLRAALNAVSTLESIDASQKTLIYISNGYVNFDRVRTSPTRSDLAYEAMRAHVVIHVIDPRGFFGGVPLDLNVDEATWQEYLEETRASLHAIADNTGLVLTGGNLEDGLKQLVLSARR